MSRCKRSYFFHWEGKERKGKEKALVIVSGCEEKSAYRDFILLFC